MEAGGEAPARAAAVYDAASDHYDDEANAYWERFGRRTVERLALQPGARVLDVCCGSGASALPAAEAVGPTGSVLGVDLSGELLRLARAKAERGGLRNATFAAGDMLHLEQPDEAFDVVMCVFGIFFAPDMRKATAELWRRVRPGGRLVVTTWGPRFFEPLSTPFWDSVRAVRPDLDRSFHPWDRISEPEDVRALLAAAGAVRAEAVLEEGSHPLRSPADWWRIVLGTGYRGTVEQLTAGEREHVRRESLAAAAEVRSVEANVVYAVATAPRS